MDPALIGLLAALVGAVAGLAGGWLSGWQQSRLEYKKWLRAREDATNKELRLAIADVMKKMAIASQTISWFTWEADYYPESLTKNNIEEYDTQMRHIFPQIESALILVSAYDSDVYQKLSPIINQIYELDLKVSREIRGFAHDPLEAASGVASYRAEAYELRRKIMDNVSNIARQNSREIGS